MLLLSVCGAARCCSRASKSVRSSGRSAREDIFGVLRWRDALVARRDRWAQKSSGRRDGMHGKDGSGAR